ncbi:MAG: SpoIID/LytB domain-containing protein [Oculatellaceae cyanobacterium Prado106]|nr:SpoIID/LytB domain-containing protein [Oculatellaceae cyanobacterium Prado106]
MKQILSVLKQNIGWLALAVGGVAIGGGLFLNQALMRSSVGASPNSDTASDIASDAASSLPSVAGSTAGAGSGSGTVGALPSPGAGVAAGSSPSPGGVPTAIASGSTASPTPAGSPSASAKPQATASPTPNEPQTVNPQALSAQEQALNEAGKERLAASQASSVDSLVEMRVAIAQGVSSLRLSASQGAVLVDGNGGLLQDLAAGTAYTIEPGGEGLLINGQPIPFGVRVEPPAGGLITVGDRTYRGRFVLVNDSGKVWAVNLINLRQYLYSVVASEVSPTWQANALKAQAIAARSYALTYHFKPMSSLFDLGSTEYYQVYSGIGREAEATNQAVDATAGEYVSYKGGVVESLYAASEDIVAEAFQGQGMSQLGALSLAEQGYTYQQILNKYYPGTKVARFQQDF